MSQKIIIKSFEELNTYLNAKEESETKRNECMPQQNAEATQNTKEY